MNAVNSSGELLTDSIPTAASCSMTLGVRPAVTIAVCSLAMMCFGVPAGARKPYHKLASCPGTVSPTVGRFGNALERFAPAVAIMRSLPVFACGVTLGPLPK